jgi:hypothetical protein
VPEEQRRQRRAATETFNPRPLSPQTRSPRIQSGVFESTIPPRPTMDKAASERPKLDLPNLPHATPVRKGRNPKKRQAP